MSKNTKVLFCSSTVFHGAQGIDSDDIYLGDPSEFTNSEDGELRFSYFNIKYSSNSQSRDELEELQGRDELDLNVSVMMDYANIVKYYGSSTLNSENREFYCRPENVSYGAFVDFFAAILSVDDSIYTEIKEIKEHSLIAPCLTEEELKNIFARCRNMKLPALPRDLISFFVLVANGIAFNGKELWGAKEGLITSEDGRNYYKEIVPDKIDESNLIFLGSGDDDYYCYNFKTHSYEVRDRNDLEVMESYDDFWGLLGEILAH